MSTQFLRNQKNWMIDLKQHLERYANCFGFNSRRYDLNLVKSCLIPYLICDTEIKPTVNIKANDLKSVWEQHSMITFEEFLRKDVVPTLKAIAKNDIFSP